MSDSPKVDSQALQIIGWATSLAACVYFVWIYIQVSRYTTEFAKLFESMGVELPGPTAIVMGGHNFLYPLIFVGAGVFLVGKEIFLRDKKLSIAVTFAVAFCVLQFVGWIHAALYAPIFTMVEKLSK